MHNERHLTSSVVIFTAVQVSVDQNVHSFQLFNQGSAAQGPLLDILNLYKILLLSVWLFHNLDVFNHGMVIEQICWCMVLREGNSWTFVQVVSTYIIFSPFGHLFLCPQFSMNHSRKEQFCGLCSIIVIMLLMNVSSKIVTSCILLLYDFYRSLRVFIFQPEELWPLKVC